MGLGQILVGAAFVVGITGATLVLVKNAESAKVIIPLWLFLVMIEIFSKFCGVLDIKYGDGGSYIWNAWEQNQQRKITIQRVVVSNESWKEITSGQLEIVNPDPNAGSAFYPMKVHQMDNNNPPWKEEANFILDRDIWFDLLQEHRPQISGRFEHILAVQGATRILRVDPTKKFNLLLRATGNGTKGITKIASVFPDPNSTELRVRLHLIDVADFDINTFVAPNVLSSHPRGS